MIRALIFAPLVVWAASFINTALNLLLIRRLRDSPLAHVPLVSIIIPARNEARSIERTVRAFLAQTYPRLEIVVVDDHSTDATGNILDRVAREDSRVAILHGDEPPAGWLGKPWALHQGSRRATGELFHFVDADIIYEPGAIGATVAEIQRSDAALVALLPRVEMKGFWEQVSMPMLAIAFFVLLPSWLANRSRSVRLALGGGAGMLVRRSGYEDAGGHAALRDAVVDDIGLARLIRRHGGRTLTVRADHLIHMRMYHGGREIVNGFTKNMFSAMARSYLIAGTWMAIGLVCNILPYALALTGNLPAIITVALITLTRVLVFASLGYRLDNAVLGHPLMMTFWGGVLLRSAWKTGFRGEVQWRGRTYQTAPR